MANCNQLTYLPFKGLRAVRLHWVGAVLLWQVRGWSRHGNGSGTGNISVESGRYKTHSPRVVRPTCANSVCKQDVTTSAWGLRLRIVDEITLLQTVYMKKSLRLLDDIGLLLVEVPKVLKLLGIIYPPPKYWGTLSPSLPIVMSMPTISKGSLTGPSLFHVVTTWR